MDFDEAEFRDRMGRKICMVEEEAGVVATMDGQTVGRLTVASIDLGFVPGKDREGFRLTSISVEPEFQRAGIGLEMLVNAKSWFYPLDVPATGPPPYLALLAAAARKGVLIRRWPDEHDEVRRKRR